MLQPLDLSLSDTVFIDCSTSLTFRTFEEGRNLESCRQKRHAVVVVKSAVNIKTNTAIFVHVNRTTHNGSTNNNSVSIHKMIKDRTRIQRELKRIYIER